MATGCPLSTTRRWPTTSSKNTVSNIFPVKTTSYQTGENLGSFDYRWDRRSVWHSLPRCLQEGWDPRHQGWTCWSHQHGNEYEDNGDGHDYEEFIEDHGEEEDDIDHCQENESKKYLLLQSDGQLNILPNELDLPAQL